jgi:hypothetical protein
MTEKAGISGLFCHSTGIPARRPTKKELAHLLLIDYRATKLLVCEKTATYIFSGRNIDTDFELKKLIIWRQ